MEPNRVKPITDRELPMRRKLRRDIDDPKWAKSMIETEEPIRDKPQSDTELPSLANARRDIDDPNCRTSNTDNDAPSLVTP